MTSNREERPSANPYVLHRAERDVEHRIRDVVVFLRSEVEAVLGPAGRLLSGSKSAYTAGHPGHLVYFNACLWDSRGREIWFGDVDLSLDSARDQVQKAADAVGEVLYLTRERYRFDGFDPARDSDAEDVMQFQPRPAGQ